MISGLKENHNAYYVHIRRIGLDHLTNSQVKFKYPH